MLKSVTINPRHAMFWIISNKEVAQCDQRQGDPNTFGKKEFHRKMLIFKIGFIF